MKRFFGKKQVMLATLAVALGAAVYLNYYFARQDLSPGKSDGASVTTTAGHLGDSQYVNGTTSPTTGKTSAPTTAADTGTPYFAAARQNRERARAEALELLQDLANDVKSSQAVIDDATKKIVAVAKAVEQESKIESLVKSKGFADCVVYIEGANCNAVVQSDGLSAAQTLQITEIITAQSEVSSENIKITAVKS